MIIWDHEPLPVQGNAAITLLRKAEKDVLDPFYRQHPFWKLEPRIAFNALLNAIDSFAIVGMMNQQRSKSAGNLTYQKMCNEAFVAAIRWVDEANWIDIGSSAVTGDQLDAAGDFLLLATNYCMLEQHHHALGRGLFSVSTDEAGKIIRFNPAPENAQAGPAVNLQHLVASNERANRAKRPEIISLIDRATAELPIQTRDGKISYLTFINAIDEQLMDLCWHLSPQELVPLSDSASMGCFEYWQFSRYWRVMSAWSFIVLNIYTQCTRDGLSQLDYMPTQCVPRQDFCKWMGKLARLPFDIVSSITDFLTFNRRTKRPDAFLQPLFADSDTVMWSPLIVALSRQPRNALKLICRTKETSDFGATLNASRERPFLNRFGSFLQKHHGFAYKLGVDIGTRGKQGEIDLLAYQSSSPHEVLIVQAKTPIAADEQNEISAVTQDLIVAQEQCRVCVEILKQLPLTEKQRLFPFVRWNVVREFYPIVITPDSESNARYDHTAIPAISLAVLESLIPIRKLRSPQRLWQAMRDWKVEAKPTRPFYFRLCMGEVSYDLPAACDMEGPSNTPPE